MQVQPGLGVDFAHGVRTLMRQDPDIIMVGEIRDRDTADMAVQAALTGHLVLSTLHTNDAPTAVTRLLDLGVPPYLLSSTLLGVMAQRLVRTLCPHCKKPGPPPDDETWRAITAPWRAEKPAEVMTPVGCLECRMTGYFGRIGLYEIMLMSPGVRRLHHARRRRQQDPRAGLEGRHEAAAGVGGDEGRRRRDHRRRGREGRAARLTGGTAKPRTTLRRRLPPGNADMRIESDLKLDFKDVLVRPKRSTLTTRSDVDISREFRFRHSGTEYHGIPIIAANMDATGTIEMARVLDSYQLSTALHKHYSVDTCVEFFRALSVRAPRSTRWASRAPTRRSSSG